MGARWVIVLLVAAGLVLTPLAIKARPVAESPLGAVDLVRRVQASAAVPWSGTVQTTGTLAVPEDDSFATLGQLLAGDNQLRVWWRGPQEWRVDRLRSTGETDLFRSRGLQVRWVFESNTATISPVSRIRLPDAGDVLPATLARSVLQGARDGEVARLPSARVAGRVAAGLRVTPDDPAASVDHVDLWVEPESGLPLRVQLYGDGDVRPVLSTTVTRLDLAQPASSDTVFQPAVTTTMAYEDAVDVAAAANAFAPYRLPNSLAGLPARGGEVTGAVGVYGRGATVLIALPLRGQISRPLRERLAASASARETAVGTIAPVGPITLLLTAPRPGGPAFLLAGTVTVETAERAVADLRLVPA